MTKRQKEQQRIEAWSEKSNDLLDKMSKLNQNLVQAYRDGNLEKARKIKVNIALLEDEITTCLIELKYFDEIVEIVPE